VSEISGNSNWVAVWIEQQLGLVLEHTARLRIPPLFSPTLKMFYSFYKWLSIGGFRQVAEGFIHGTSENEVAGQSGPSAGDGSLSVVSLWSRQQLLSFQSPVDHLHSAAFNQPRNGHNMPGTAARTPPTYNASHLPW
jgi:hypothetical protein